MIRLGNSFFVNFRRQYVDWIAASTTLVLINGFHTTLSISDNPTQRDRTQLNVVKRYRKLLQDLFQSGSFSEEVALLQITNIIPCERKGHFEVHCILPSSRNATDTESRGASLALRLQQLVNANAKEIRAKVSQNRVEYKQPTFHFTVSTDIEPPCAVKPQLIDLTTYNPSATITQKDVLLSVVKPSNVYGLLRDDLLRKVRSKAKDRVHESEQVSVLGEVPTPNTDPKMTAEWAKIWKQRQDWRSEARRERKRARQNVGLYRLTMGQNGLTILDVDDEDQDQEQEA